MVVVDEVVDLYWKEKSSKGPSTGLVVGFNDHVVVAIPTPESSDAIDPEWVAEHSTQVTRMLVGGLRVLGVYVLQSSETWGEKVDFMNKCTKSVASALSENGSFHHIEGGLLQLFVAQDKYLCKKATNSTTQETPVKIQPSTLQNLHTLTCTYSLSLTIPVAQTQAQAQAQSQSQESPATPISYTLVNQVDSAVSQFESRLKDLVAVLDGKVYPLTSGDKATPLSALGSSREHTASLFAPSIGHVSNVAKFSKGTSTAGGFADIEGNIVGVAVGGPNSTVEELLASLKEDLSATVRTRLNLVCDQDTLTPELPSRYVARVSTSRNKPQFDNSVLLCDYVNANETVKDVEERFAGLLALALPKLNSKTMCGVILREDIVVQPPPEKEQVPQPQQTQQRPQQVQQNNNNLLLIVAALVVAVLAVVLVFVQKN